MNSKYRLVLGYTVNKPPKIVYNLTWKWNDKFSTQLVSQWLYTSGWTRCAQKLLSFCSQCSCFKTRRITGKWVTWKRASLHKFHNNQWCWSVRELCLWNGSLVSILTIKGSHITSSLLYSTLLLFVTLVFCLQCHVTYLNGIYQWEDGALYKVTKVSK